MTKQELQAELTKLQLRCIELEREAAHYKQQRDDISRAVVEAARLSASAPEVVEPPDAGVVPYDGCECGDGFCAGCSPEVA